MKHRCATLGGTSERPELVVSFPYGARHPGTREDLVEWVKQMPGRAWDAEGRCWRITSPGEIGRAHV